MTDSRSKCCNAPVTVKGMGDFYDKDEVVTINHHCTRCEKVCDVVRKCKHKWQLEKLFSQKIGDESLCVEAMMATLICTECWGHKTVESKPITDEN